MPRWLGLVVCFLGALLPSQAQDPLAQTAALGQASLAPLYYEPASAYNEAGELDLAAAEERPLRPLGISDPARFDPYIQSHNLEWLDTYRRRGVPAFTNFRYQTFRDPAPAYQVYRKQQHQGQLGGFGAYGGLGAPIGFGHGGFQNSFSQAEFDYDATRAPNFKLGPLTATFDAFSSTEWIDRPPTTVAPDGSPSSEDSLFIISGGIDTSAQWQISERGVLDIRIGAGFDYYPDGRPGSDGLEADYVDFQVLPNTYSTYSFGVGDAEVIVYDQFARFRNRAYSYYSLDPLDYADYQEHALGATVSYPLNDRVTADAGYEFGQLDTLSSGDEYLDHHSNSYFGGLSYSPDQTWELGVQGSAANFDYDEADRPDGSSASAGIFFNLPLSSYTRLSAAAGAHRFEFDRVEGVDDSDSLDDGYWSAAIENDLNDRVTHSITVASGANFGISSNYIESIQASYTAQWRVFDETLLTAGVNFHSDDESGGTLPEEIDAIDYLVGVRQQLSEHAAVGINYTQQNNDSDLAGRDYDQGRLQVYCSVDLGEKLEMRASYQRWDVDSQAELNSFTQNSATIGFTYHF